MKKLYVSIKSLGHSLSEPIYEMDLKINTSSHIYYTKLEKQKFKMEGNLLSKFYSRLQELNEDINAVEFDTEKDMLIGFLDFLNENSIDEIVTEDKLIQMLLIRERMRQNKFKSENYGFSDYKLSEDPSYFTKEEKTKEQNILQKVKELIRNEK